MAPVVGQSATQVTYHYERWRAVTSGILETATSTFLLLIAVKHFEAGATAKALVAGGNSFGLILSPLVVTWVAARSWRTAQAAAAIAALGAVCFVFMACWPHQLVFVLGSVLATTATSSVIPLLTQIYQENYPAESRGRLFSRTVMIRIGTAALFSESAGQVLSGNIEKFRILLLVFAGAFGAASYCLSRCPSRPLTAAQGTHPFRAMRFAKVDRLFRLTLITWMLMGFANLMMLPMRIEYLANPKYGLALTVGEIAFLTGVLPNLARLILSPVWGWLFDRMNFFLLRATLNLGYALGILSFFSSHDVTGLIVGALVFGISNSGSDVAWSLWVTKFAPADYVADYMSVHTFFTGVRGMLAPFAAFYLIQVVSMITLTGIAVGLILISSLLLWRELPLGRFGKKAEALLEEAPE